MQHMSDRRQRTRALPMAWVVLVAVACGRGEPPRAPAPPASTAASPGTPARPAGAPGPDSTAAPAAPRDAKQKAPAPAIQPESMGGYFVFGTDERSFLPCGEKRVIGVSGRSPGMPMMIEQYRFRALRPLSPVYYKLTAVRTPDTLMVGATRYRKSLVVLQVSLDAGAPPPDCRSPGRGSLLHLEH